MIFEPAAKASYTFNNDLLAHYIQIMSRADKAVLPNVRKVLVAPMRPSDGKSL